MIFTGQEFNPSTIVPTYGAGEASKVHPSRWPERRPVQSKKKLNGIKIFIFDGINQTSLKSFASTGRTARIEL